MRCLAISLIVKSWHFHRACLFPWYSVHLLHLTTRNSIILHPWLRSQWLRPQKLHSSTQQAQIFHKKSYHPPWCTPSVSSRNVKLAIEMPMSYLKHFFETFKKDSIIWVGFILVLSLYVAHLKIQWIGILSSVGLHMNSFIPWATTEVEKSISADYSRFAGNNDQGAMAFVCYSRGEWITFRGIAAVWEYEQSDNRAQGGVPQLGGNLARLKGTTRGSERKGSRSVLGCVLFSLFLLEIEWYHGPGGYTTRIEMISRKSRQICSLSSSLFYWRGIFTSSNY